MNREKLENAITGNDVAAIRKVFDEAGLAKSGKSCYSHSGQKCAFDALSFASAASYTNPISEDLFKEIVDRTAMVVDVFRVAEAVAVAARIGTDDFSLIPEDIQTALRENHYTDKVGEAIEGLNDNAFAALLSSITTGDVNCLNVKFNPPIIRRMYAAIPEYLLLAYMAMFLTKPETRKSFTLVDISGGLPDGMLGMLLGGFRPF